MSELRLRERVVNTGMSLVAAAFLCVTFGASAQGIGMIPIMTDPSAKPADPSAKIPEFDVASIKENKSEQHMMKIGNTPDGFSGVNLSLKTLIGLAYGVKQDQISGGGGWIDSTGFDVEAKVAGPDVEVLKKLSQEQRRQILKPLLAERFKLKLHSEMKVMPVYDLVVAKGGPKLTVSTAVPIDPKQAMNMDPKAVMKGAGSMRMGPGQFTGTGLGIASLAGNLSYTVHRMVLDKTGLTGKYDFTLTFAPENGSPASADNSAPDIFTAVQEQLGLKLVSSKGEVENLVIDHAEMPTEN